MEEQTETDEYKKYLHGPQLKGQGVSQSQVDEMLSKGGPAPAQSQPQQNQAPQPPVQKVAEAPKVAPQTQKAPKPQVQAPPKKEPEPETSGKPLDQSSIDSLFD
ncbi:MAG: hypothetical protein BWY78_01493 [Alphaproteobacteria bacterium ADurb.Bin438]|nr:MAG: hypothetical protein BWY78_01493 [Alphaproteobacteria bacterium ADurb.Bin438]